MAHRFYVSEPGHWWLATRSEVPLADPTPEGRWAGKPQPSWRRIAYAVEELGRDLAYGAYETEPDGSARVEVERTLDKPELDIVRSWFSAAHPPMVDPWEPHIYNGRHRLWGAWSVAPDLLLPIYAYSLGYDEDARRHGPVAHRRWQARLAGEIARTPPAVAARNELFMASARRLVASDPSRPRSRTVPRPQG